MLTLLFWVIVLGLLAYCVNVLPLPQPFKTVGFVILILILVYVIFEVFGLAAGIPHPIVR